MKYSEATDEVFASIGLPKVGEKVDAENIYGTGYSLEASLMDVKDEWAYRKAPKMSQSEFKIFMKEPEHYYSACLLKKYPYEKKAHFELGKDAEFSVLYNEFRNGEPLVVSNDLLDWSKRPAKWYEENQIKYEEDNPDHHIMKKGKRFKAFAADSKNKGKWVLTKKEFDEQVKPLVEMRDQVSRHEYANQLLFGEGINHVPIEFTCPYSGIECKGELDRLVVGVNNRPIMVDYKTGLRNDIRSMQKSFVDFGYYIQATWYQEAVRQLTGHICDVYYICQETSTKESIVEVFKISNEWFRIGHEKWKHYMDKYCECEESGLWVRDTHGTVQHLNPPEWFSGKSKGNFES